MSKPPSGRWVYPFATMDIGDGTFVADRGGLSDAAATAVCVFREAGWPIVLRTTEMVWGGVAGLHIERVK